jgi:hypothetical protein
MQKPNPKNLSQTMGQPVERYHPPPQVVTLRLLDREASAKNTSRLAIEKDQWFDTAHCKKASQQSDWWLQIFYRKSDKA